MFNPFAQVDTLEPDAIFHLNAEFQKDQSPDKINVGIGAYRTDDGEPWVLPVVKKVHFC